MDGAIPTRRTVLHKLMTKISSARHDKTLEGIQRCLALCGDFLAYVQRRVAEQLIHTAKMPGFSKYLFKMHKLQSDSCVFRLPNLMSLCHPLTTEWQVGGVTELSQAPSDRDDQHERMILELQAVPRLHSNSKRRACEGLSKRSRLQLFQVLLATERLEIIVGKCSEDRHAGRDNVDFLERCLRTVVMLTGAVLHPTSGIPLGRGLQGVSPASYCAATVRNLVTPPVPNIASSQEDGPKCKTKLGSSAHQSCFEDSQRLGTQDGYRSIQGTTIALDHPTRLATRPNSIGPDALKTPHPV